jgi:hypothetical protein
MSAKSTYQLKGWFPIGDVPPSILNKNLESGSIPCYICDKATELANIVYSRTIPRVSIPEDKRNIINNFFIVCDKCVIAKRYVQAPRNYEMVVSHRTMNNIIIAAELDELEIIMHRKAELEFDKNTALRECAIYQREILEINEKCEAIYRNKELEIERLKSLRVYADQSNAIYDAITKKVEAMRNRIKTFHFECAAELAEIHGTVQSNYNSIISLVSKEQAKLIDLASIEVNSDYTCNICCIRRIQTALNPCGHVMCELCFEKLRDNSIDEHEWRHDNLIKCPFCKTESTDSIRIFV